MPNHKTILTQRLVELAGNITLDQATRLWYKNIRSNSGMRLTHAGLQAFLALDLEHWSVAIDVKKINKKMLLDLDRRLQYPYYIDGKKRQLVLFSSREALMANLYGDLQAWLTSLERNSE